MPKVSRVDKVVSAGDQLSFSFSSSSSSSRRHLDLRMRQYKPNEIHISVYIHNNSSSSNSRSSVSIIIIIIISSIESNSSVCLPNINQSEKNTSRDLPNKPFSSSMLRSFIVCFGYDD